MSINLLVEDGSILDQEDNGDILLDGVEDTPPGKGSRGHRVPITIDNRRNAVNLYDNLIVPLRRIEGELETSPCPVGLILQGTISQANRFIMAEVSCTAALEASLSATRVMRSEALELTDPALSATLSRTPLKEAQFLAAVHEEKRRERVRWLLLGV